MHIFLIKSSSCYCTFRTYYMCCQHVEYSIEVMINDYLALKEISIITYNVVANS